MVVQICTSISKDIYELLLVPPLVDPAFVRQYDCPQLLTPNVYDKRTVNISERSTFLGYIPVLLSIPDSTLIQHVFSSI